MKHRRRIPALITATAVAGALLSAAGAQAASTGPSGSSPAAQPIKTTASALPAGSAATVAESPSGRYIVQVDRTSSGVGERIARIIRARKGSVVSLQGSLGMLTVQADRTTAQAIAATPGVRTVTPDRTAKTQALGFTASSQPGSMTNITRVTGAQSAWKAGYTGSGVDVAVIDTGMAPVSSMKDSAKVVVGPDVSFESQATNLRYLDTFGHGTAMSSIIAGREVAKGTGANYAKDTTNFYGMAPDSRIVSLKLADRNGTVDVSQLIAAIDWVVQNRKSNGLNIRVLNLSFGTDSSQSYVSDPLAYAAQVAWDNGIFVVASAGNDGKGASGLADPAYNPNLFAVGAVDTKGTDAMSDDVVADFSQHPNSTVLKREPDLVAPGVKIVSAGVPGSWISTNYPAAKLGNGFIRGSGTSQAAAVVSGAAALLYQKWPTMNPADVKELLTRTATKLPNQSTALQGRGELNVTAALASAPMSSNLFTGLLGGLVNTATGILNTGLLPATGAGSLEGSRGSFHVTMDGATLSGEKDIMSAGWANGVLVLLTKQLKMWGTDGKFNGNLWTNGAFATDATTVAGKTWGGRSWAGRSWAGTSWSGRSWAGRSWSAATWDGSSWTSDSWPTVVSRPGWTASQWSTASWN